MLSDRYQRRSAEAAYKVRVGENNWGTESKKFFGATVLHRRIPFNDAALDGRTVFVRFRADHNRRYRDFDPEDAGNVEGRELIHTVTFKPPSIEPPKGVAGRILNTYKLLLSTAKLCARLLTETAELKEAQSCEPDGLVLRAIVEAVFKDEYSDPNFANIKYSVLAKSIWENHRFSLTPRQIGPIARDLGFETITSHGVTVVAPTPATLIKACDECEYMDEAIDELRREMLDLEKAPSKVHG